MFHLAHVTAYRNYIENRDRSAVRDMGSASTTTGDQLLTEQQVAWRQARSVRTLQNQRVLGGGIPYLKLGRAVRYRLSDVVAWEEARRFSSTSEEGERDV